jgi:hypothetical protein
VISEKDFNTVTGIIVDNFEGGYYHPDMFTDGRIKDLTGEARKIYATSGETMYGLDRKAGGSLNTSEAGQKFWAVIDTQKARSLWPYNYPYQGSDKVQLIGGVTLDQIKSLLKTQLALVMKPTFDKLYSSLLSSKAQNVISNCIPLLLHFAYATWNGAGFFKFYAKSFNQDVESNQYTPAELFKRQMDLRKGSQYVQIRTSGAKMSDIGNKILTGSAPGSEFPILPALILVIGAALLLKK